MATLKEWVHYKLGPQCAICGFYDHRAMEVDHIDPRTKDTRGTASRRRWNGMSDAAKLIRAGRGDELQLLCAICHAIKTYEEKDYLERECTEEIPPLIELWEGGQALPCPQTVPLGNLTPLA